MSGYDSESGSSGYLYSARPQRVSGSTCHAAQIAARHPLSMTDTWYSGVASSSPPHSASTPFSPHLPSLPPPASTSANSMPYAGGLVPPLHVPQHVPAAARAAIASAAPLLPPPTEPPPPPPALPHQPVSASCPLYSNTPGPSPRACGGAGVHRVCGRLLTGVFVVVAAAGVCLVVVDSLLRYRWPSRVHALLSIGVLMLFVAAVMLVVLCRRTVTLVSAGSGARSATSAHRLLLPADTGATNGQYSKHSFSRSPPVGASVGGFVCEQMPLTRVFPDEAVHVHASEAVLVCGNSLPHRPTLSSEQPLPAGHSQSALHTPLLRHARMHEPVYQESEYSHPWDHLANRHLSGENTFASSTRPAPSHEYVNASRGRR